MQYLLGFILLFELLILVFIYIKDKDLKLVSQFGVKKVKFVRLTRWKYFFVYSKRNEGVITKHSFVCMIANYLINGALITLFCIQLVTHIPENDSLFANIYVVFTALNGGLFFVIVSQPILNPEQRKMWEEQETRLVIEESNRELAKQARRTEERKKKNPSK